MKRALIFAMGVFAGQWLVFGSGSSPAGLHVKAQVAYEHRDYVEAMRLWSQAVSLQPDNATFHYSRATALARLGLRLSAADAYQMSLLLHPPRDLARQAMEGLASLSPAPASTGAQLQDSTVPLESGMGVWIAMVTVNGRHRGRFLVDTGSSVIVLAPAFARAAGVRSSGGRAAVELQTLSGRTSAPSATLTSLRVGDAELRDAPVVLHDPGPGLEGILGNTFLSQYRVTVDGDRRELRLTSVARD